MPPPDSATQGTPLAPSVEKAYYRKCIALKRRLNEVETANDESRVRRQRLDRAILKMRLERAFLLDALRKRMDPDVEGSEGSVEEGLVTPPIDRPHRDKRRRPQQNSGNAPDAMPVYEPNDFSSHPPQYNQPRGLAPRPNGPLDLRNPSAFSELPSMQWPPNAHEYAPRVMNELSGQPHAPGSRPFPPPGTGASERELVNGDADVLARLTSVNYGGRQPGNRD